MDWQEFIFNPHEDWIGRMEKRARKRFSDENIADEALNYVLKKLGENNWQRLSVYQGRSKPSTFLYSILNNQLEDFSRKKYGYPRPPVWIERLGPFWKIIWKRLCLERENPQVLSVIYKGTNDQVDQIIRTIKAKITGCGQTSSITSIGGTVSNEDYDIDDKIVKHSLAGDLCNEHMEKEFNNCECHKLLSALCLSLDIEMDNHKIASASVAIEIQAEQFRTKFKLEAEQLLLLKLKYQQGYKIPAIATILKLKEHSVRRRLQQAEKKVFQLLQDLNFDLDDFLVK